MPLGNQVTELSATLRDCLMSELALKDNPPAETCIITGEDGRTFLSVGTQQDRCCSGFAWVRVAGVRPVDPPPETDPGNCGTLVWQLDFEMGVARCAPTSADFPAHDAGCAAFLASAVQVNSDMDAMSRAACCLLGLTPSGRAWPQQWLPFGPEGGCTGGIMGVSVKLDDCDSC